MASYHKDNISLSEALTMELPHVVRTWGVPGPQVQSKEIPVNANVYHTFVMSHKDSKTCVGVMYTLQGERSVYSKSIAEYPVLDIEILEKDFPSLFKLTGNLSAFGEE